MITQKQKSKKGEKKKIECKTLMGKKLSLSEIYRIKKCKMYKKVYNLQKVKHKKCKILRKK